MSVLFKALQKAEKTRAASAGAVSASMNGGSGPSAASKGAGKPGAGRTIVRLMAVSVLLLGGAAGAAVVLFPEDTEMLLAEVMGEAAPPPARVTFTPRPKTQPAPVATTAATAPAEAPAGVPASDGQASDGQASGVQASPAAAASPSTPTDGNDLAPLLAAARETKARQDAAEDAARKQQTLAERAAEAETVAPTTAPVIEFSAQSPSEPAAPKTQPAPVSLAATLASQQAEAQAVRAPVTVDHKDTTPAANTIQVTLSDPDARDLAVEGYSALMRGDYRRALELYDTALKSEPRSARALAGRAAALHKLHRTDEARQAYERVLAVAPGNREALTNLVALTASANPDTALSGLRRLESQAPNFSPVVAQIGLLMAESGATDEAVPYLVRAASLEPNNALYRYNLAVTLDTAGRGEEAAAAYQSTIDMARSGDTPPLAVPLRQIEDRLQYLKSVQQGR